jgi:hypothetical protein
MKNWGPCNEHLTHVASMPGFVSGRARQRRHGKTADDPRPLLSDFVRFSFLDG